MGGMSSKDLLRRQCSHGDCRCRKVLVLAGPLQSIYKRVYI